MHASVFSELSWNEEFPNKSVRFRLVLQDKTPSTLVKVRKIPSGLDVNQLRISFSPPPPQNHALVFSYHCCSSCKNSNYLGVVEKSANLESWCHVPVVQNAHYWVEQHLQARSAVPLSLLASHIFTFLCGWEVGRPLAARRVMKWRNSMSASCAMQLIPWDADIQCKPLLAWPFPSDTCVSKLFSAPVRYCSSLLTKRDLWSAQSFRM